jgi:hypothetical protein
LKENGPTYRDENPGVPMIRSPATKSEKHMRGFELPVGGFERGGWRPRRKRAHGGIRRRPFG